MLNGYSFCDNEGRLLDMTHERPSMELGLHLKIKHPVVFHTHPVYLNTILCSKNSRSTISAILEDYDYDYIPYETPGEDLKNAIQNSTNNKIILLENHGLICGSTSFREVFDLSIRINQLCKEWLIKNSKTFKNFNNESGYSEEGFLFPDAVVLREKMKFINQYMLYIQRDIGLSPRFLSEQEINKLTNMEEEKYRRAIK
jgi:rhamnose utilization protein RhaD (predicted bifunctional aldolase and dehydrogenase)